MNKTRFKPTTRAAKMRTNNYSNDQGLNPNRIDIRMNCKDGLTIKEVIEAIQKGENYIRCIRGVFQESYNNELCTALNEIGIKDIRYSGEYTLYKENVKFQLSGNHDDDYFISENDMNEILFDILMSCHHQGACDSDCNEASDYFEIKDYKRAKQYIIDCGIEEENLKNESDIFSYYIWMLAGDIQDRQDENES